MKQTLNKYKDKLLVIVPYVFYKIVDNTVHFYNSRTGFSIIRKSKKLAHFLQKNKSKHSNYFYLNSLEMYPSIESFIETIQNDLFGFVISLKNNNSEPIQFIPSILNSNLNLKVNKQLSNIEYNIKNLNEIHVFSKKEDVEQFYFFESNKIKILFDRGINSNIDIKVLLRI